ncbi:MAG TPA: GNAT family protein [Acidimicrobiales bacterium]|nr:GNAT family protein [Acidimicrobiales bacterium]
MGEVILRPIEEADLSVLRRIQVDPDASGEFEWFGFQPAKANETERRLREDGLVGGEVSYLAVGLADGTCAGIVDWKPRPHGNWEIGIVLLPEHRGRGLGTEAQRLLVRYLFDNTTAHRIEAGTEVDNVAEQRALERCGFRREGVTRGVHFRAGHWRDGVVYGLTREDLGPR